MKNILFLFPFILIIFFFTCCTLDAGNDPASSKTWALVWSDEFDGPSIDSVNWGFDIGRGPNNDGFGTWNLDYLTDRTNNAFISNGNLVIQSLNESYMGYSFTTAQVTTKGKRFFQYGKLEARIKLPRGYGMWPGFCMYGTNIDDIGWPQCGEIDIMEMRGGDAGDSNRTIMGTVHYQNAMTNQPYPQDWTYETSSYTLPGSADFSDDFHVFGIVWDSSKIIFQLDGLDYYTNSITVWYKSEFQGVFYFYFNVMIGGTFYGSPPPTVGQITATFPQTMVVDWVRYYKME